METTVKGPRHLWYYIFLTFQIEFFFQILLNAFIQMGYPVVQTMASTMTMIEVDYWHQEVKS